MPEQNSCPCGSGDVYDRCCGPFHQDEQTAPTALALMRSRYSAYVLRLADYLLHTWHVSTRPAQLQLDREEPRWLGLEILVTRQGTATDKEGWVEFIASYQAGTQYGRMHEHSYFVREQQQWFYVSGEQLSGKPQPTAKMGRNAPCPCGSGKKYKHCCGS